MDFVEERLQVLDGWLADQPDNETLLEKREEYAGLYEELNILTKKLKKTAKLLLEETKKDTLLKLAKKQEQYSHEIEDIMAYVDQDEMFLEAEMDPSDLLGVPLETLVEQPGMEGSSANLNFSVSDLPYMPPRTTKKSPKLSMGKSLTNGNNNNGSSSNGLDHSSSGNLEAEYEELHPIKEEQSNHCNASMASLTASMHSMSTGNISTHDPATLRKKLRKVEKLLERAEDGTMDNNQIKKLNKKREEYAQALESADMIDLLENKSFHSFADSSVATMDVSTSSLFRLAANNSSSGDNMNNRKSYDKKTLQKKLKKVRKLIKSTSDEEELESYRLKEQEYQQALDELMAHGSSQSSMDISATSSIDTDDLLVELDNEERKQFRTLQKKSKKADKLLTEAQENGDSKQAKKLRSKRDEYMSAMEDLKKR
jgi:hypothetical protein